MFYFCENMFGHISTPLFVCQLKFYFGGSFDILQLSEDGPNQDRRYYESIHKGKPSDIVNDPYYSKGSVSFNEVSKNSRSGPYYTQQVVFRFPSNDRNRAQRIEIIKSMDYLGLVLTNKSELVVGRNDAFQNKKPTITTSSNTILTEVKLETNSIQPVLLINSGIDVLFGYDYTYDFKLS